MSVLPRVSLGSVAPLTWRRCGSRWRRRWWHRRPVLATTQSYVHRQHSTSAHWAPVRRGAGNEEGGAGGQGFGNNLAMRAAQHSTGAHLAAVRRRLDTRTVADVARPSAMSWPTVASMAASGASRLGWLISSPKQPNLPAAQHFFILFLQYFFPLSAGNAYAGSNPARPKRRKKNQKKKKMIRRGPSIHSAHASPHLTGT